MQHELDQSSELVRVAKLFIYKTSKLLSTTRWMSNLTGNDSNLGQSPMHSEKLCKRKMMNVKCQADTIHCSRYW